MVVEGACRKKHRSRGKKAKGKPELASPAVTTPFEEPQKLKSLKQRGSMTFELLIRPTQ